MEKKDARIIAIVSLLWFFLFTVFQIYDKPGIRTPTLALEGMDIRWSLAYLPLIGHILLFLVYFVLLHAFFFYAAIRGYLLLFRPLRLSTPVFALAFSAWLFLAMVCLCFFQNLLFPFAAGSPEMELLLANTSRYPIYAFTALFFVCTLVGIGRQILRKRVIRFVFVLLLIGFVWDFYDSRRIVQGVAFKDKPNVIVVGLEAFRRDVINIHEGTNNWTPFINARFREGVVFDDATTTFSRTNASLVSVLTGLYPVNHGARDNLYPISKVKTDRSIVHSLKERGYQTVFFLADVRFAPITKEYGFETTVVPAYGLTDVVFDVGTDFVLPSLFANTFIARFLASPLYGNKGISRTFLPGSFEKMIYSELNKLSSSKPSFLFFHLSPTHWPYLTNGINELVFDPWGFPSDHKQFVHNNLGLSPRYVRAAEVLDGHFEKIWKALELRGLLENAIVVIVSDHGQGFGAPKDRLYPSSDRAKEVKNPYMDTYAQNAYIQSPSQISIPMAMIRFEERKTVWAPTIVDAPVSTVDIAPTIKDLLGIDLTEGDDGFSLRMGLELGEGYPGRERVRFAEAGYNPSILLSVQENDSAIKEYVKLLDRFRISAQLIPEWKEDFAQSIIIPSKQRVVFLGDWILTSSVERLEEFEIVNRKKKLWWDQMSVPEEAPVDQLLSLFCAHWEKEIKYIPFCKEQEDVQFNRSR
jgi:hypothetical protein